MTTDIEKHQKSHLICNKNEPVETTLIFSYLRVIDKSRKGSQEFRAKSLPSLIFEAPLQDRDTSQSKTRTHNSHKMSQSSFASSHRPSVSRAQCKSRKEGEEQDERSQLPKTSKHHQTAHPML
jgi:hypothetical protein